jgi:hypothetical protein
VLGRRKSAWAEEECLGGGRVPGHNSEADAVALSGAELQALTLF